MNFYIIEDDPATRRMLEKLIDGENLGEVVGMIGSGLDVKRQVVNGADIVLVDLLMPGRDGIETIRALRQEGYGGKFVMISQVENKEMVGEAYAAGVEYYIHKPVNRLEVTSVLRKVIENLSLKKSLEAIKQSLSMLEDLGSTSLGKVPNSTIPPDSSLPFTTSVLTVLTQLGVAGEAGHKDLCRLFSFLYHKEKEGFDVDHLPPLKELYDSFLLWEKAKPEGLFPLSSSKALEQRLRRLIFQVMSHIASIGLTDYANPTFEYYAPRLFEFQDVRLRMKEIEQGEKNSKCKINIRKFLLVLYTECKLQFE